MSINNLILTRFCCKSDKHPNSPWCFFWVKTWWKKLDSTSSCRCSPPHHLSFVERFRRRGPSSVWVWRQAHSLWLQIDFRHSGSLMVVPPMMQHESTRMDSKQTWLHGYGKTPVFWQEHHLESRAMGHARAMFHSYVRHYERARASRFSSNNNGRAYGLRKDRCMCGFKGLESLLTLPDLGPHPVSQCFTYDIL